jgi:hypothetical protein
LSFTATTSTATLSAACTGEYQFTSWLLPAPHVVPGEKIFDRITAPPWTVNLPTMGATTCPWQVDFTQLNVTHRKLLAAAQGGEVCPTTTTTTTTTMPTTTTTTTLPPASSTTSTTSTTKPPTTSTTACPVLDPSPVCPGPTTIPVASTAPITPQAAVSSGALPTTGRDYGDLVKIAVLVLLSGLALWLYEPKSK